MNLLRYADPSGYGCKKTGVDAVNNDASNNSNRPDFYVTPEGEIVPATGYRYMDCKYAG